jgi:hypothetical protein
MRATNRAALEYKSQISNFKLAMKTSFSAINRSVVVMFAAMVACTFLAPAARAVISEPDNRVWGEIILGTSAVTAAQTNIVVEARRSLSEPPLASYRMGENPSAGSFYSLAIPLESVNPITDRNATRTGEQIIVLVHNGQFIRYLTLYTVGPRGKITRLDLGDIDSDNNGLVDNWERQFFLNAGQDPNGDPDRDGVSNRNEMLGATNPNVPDARHPADTSPTNNVINIGEVTAYALAWKTGKAWPVAPTNIPVEFVARAGFLWKNGERYIMDTNNLAAGAPLWWTNMPPETNANRTLAAAGLAAGKNGVAKKSVLSTEKSRGRDPESAGGDLKPQITNDPGRVRRSLQSANAENSPLIVTLQVEPASGISAYAIEETLPEGWLAAEITADGVFDAASRRVRWGIFFDHLERTLSYQAQSATPNSSGALLSGSASFDGWRVETSGPGSVPLDSTRPPLHLTVALRNGAIAVKLTGEAGLRYVIQVSSDLAEWSTVATVTADQEGQIDFRERFEHWDRQR